MSMTPPPPPPPSFTPHDAGGVTGGAKPANYLAVSIVLTVVTTIFCCLIALPFAITSIVFASKVDNLWLAGDHAGANDASRKARTFSIVAGAISGAIVALYVVLLIVGVATS